MSCQALSIVEQELEKLHDTVRDTKDSNHLLMIAHTIGVLQNIRDRIKLEVPDATRIYEVLP